MELLPLHAPWIATDTALDAIEQATRRARVAQRLEAPFDRLGHLALGFYHVRVMEIDVVSTRLGRELFPLADRFLALKRRFERDPCVIEVHGFGIAARTQHSFHRGQAVVPRSHFCPV